MGETYSAAASIATRVSRALIDLDLTACTSVSRQTRTSIAPLASVGTGGTILTGLVVCTVVQIYNIKKPLSDTFSKTLVDNLSQT